MEMRVTVEIFENGYSMDYRITATVEGESNSSALFTKSNTAGLQQEAVNHAIDCLDKFNSEGPFEIIIELPDGKVPNDEDSKRSLIGDHLITKAVNSIDFIVDGSV